MFACALARVRLILFVGCFAVPLGRIWHVSRAKSFYKLLLFGIAGLNKLMKPIQQKEILELPIAKSPLSTEFKTITEILGFHTFSDLLQHRTVKLQSLPGFEQHLIYEYVEYLETNQLGHLIDP